MSITTYYTAVSLDGSIADEQHSLEWLFRPDQDGSGPLAYAEFSAPYRRRGDGFRDLRVDPRARGRGAGPIGYRLGSWPPEAYRNSVVGPVGRTGDGGDPT